MARRVEQFLLEIGDRVVRVAFHDDRDATPTTVVLIGGDQRDTGVLPLVVEEPAPDEAEPARPPEVPPEVPVYPWFPFSLRSSLEAERRRLAFFEVHIDTSELPAGRVPFVLDRFVAGINSALAEAVEQPVRLTHEEAEGWGARLFAVA